MTILPPSCNDLKRSWTSEITIMEKLKSTITFGNGIEVSLVKSATKSSISP